MNLALVAMFGIGAIELVIILLVSVLCPLTVIAVVLLVVAPILRRQTEQQELQRMCADSLIECPDGRRRISPLAEACPHCGRPMAAGGPPAA